MGRMLTSAGADGRIDMPDGVEGTAPLIGIIDDEEKVRAATAKLISSAGYRSVVFESGIVFLRHDRKQEMGCLIVDMDMPGLNGVDLLCRLAEMNYAIPTIILTGHARELREEALKLGAFAVLAKTSSGEALLKAVESAVQSTR
jgi:FixJ family two-component response regulator